MTAPRQLSDKVAVGGQPTVDDLRHLRAQGFVAVVNLRTVGETGQPLSPEAEGFAAQEAGLDYRHLPVAIPELDPDHVRRLRDAIAAATGPVYVHCGAGKRACALSLLATDAARGDNLFARAEQAGFPVTDERLKALVRDRCDRDGWDLLQAV
jgi:uncharacterized protein (TIGR01244 family)